MEEREEIINEIIEQLEELKNTSQLCRELKIDKKYIYQKNYKQKITN